MLATGIVRIFNYPRHFFTMPEYSAHRGQNVTIIRAEDHAPEALASGDEEQMYWVRAADGWEGQAFESELV